LANYRGVYIVSLLLSERGSIIVT